ncbi:MAG: hypothetical protein ABJA71_10840 [Ginsengibacter sp.]
MNYKSNYFTTAILLILLLANSACEEKKEKHKVKNKQEEKSSSDVAQNIKYTTDPDSPDCDTSLWKHVYDPTRLEVVDKCMTVTGVIEESTANDDGDQHMLLKLDAGQENLLKKKNTTKKNGDLVIEAVCINNITNPKVGGTCKGYINHIHLPKVGDHVQVSGSYVIDTHNSWAEIHPISKIEVVK